MAEPVLKLAPSLKPAKPRAATLTDALRKRMRFILLVVVPVIAVVTGLVFYMMGGRYVSPDNGVSIAGYIGSWLMAGAFLAIGACLSAVTQSQVVAFVLTLVVCFLLI